MLLFEKLTYDRIEKALFSPVSLRQRMKNRIILTIEPQPAGPTFARCALRGAHTGPNTSYGDIYINI